MRPHCLPPRSLPRCWASVFCSVLLCTATLCAQPRSGYPLVLGASGGVALGIGSAELFDGYRQTTGLRNNDFDVPLTVGAIVLVELGGVRVGATADYFRAQSLEHGSPTAAPQRELEEQLQLEMLPLLLALEVEPWRQQFRSYLSAGVGAAFARFRWYERSWNDGRLERSSIRTDMRRTVPAVRVGVGTHLFFDAVHQRSYLGALTIELRYTYSPVRLAAFALDGSASPPGQSSGDIHVGGSALMLSIGVRFQLGQSR